MCEFYLAAAMGSTDEDPLATLSESERPSAAAEEAALWWAAKLADA